MAAARLQAELEDAGFDFSGERCTAVAGGLVANHLFKVRKLRLAGDPGKLQARISLLVDEMIVLSGLGKGAVARSRSRGVCRDGPVASSSSLAATRAVVDPSRTGTLGSHAAVVELVQNSRPDVLCVWGLGPCKAFVRLAQGLGGSAAREAWAEEARKCAIVGSCPRSLRETKSGILASLA